MSEIIKNGSEEQLMATIEKEVNKPRKFHCHSCGCEFWANKKEYRYVFLKFGVYSSCPSCGRSVRWYDPDEWY